MEDNAGTKGFFDEGSPYLGHPLLTPERTAAEIDEIERLVGSVSGRVLDVGCGFGRHSVELASRQVEVTGVDSSLTMIEAARSRASQAGVPVDFRCLRSAEVSDVGDYDLAICLFTSFGQQPSHHRDDAPHLETLRRIKGALRPGGSLVLEVPDRDRCVPALIGSEQLGTTNVRRVFHQRELTVTEHFEVSGGETYHLAFRVFDKTELCDVLHDVGFKVREVRNRGLVEPPMTMMTIVADNG